MGSLPPSQMPGKGQRRWGDDRAGPGPFWEPVDTTPAPDVPPLDPSMQGGGTTYDRGPKRERAGDDRAQPRGPISEAGLNPPGAGSGGKGVGAPQPLVTPPSWVDPLYVQRLLARARTGYAGTFLTGPRGTGG